MQPVKCHNHVLLSLHAPFKETLNASKRPANRHAHVSKHQGCAPCCNLLDTFVSRELKVRFAFASCCLSRRHAISNMQHAGASPACSCLSPGVMCCPEGQTKDAFEFHFGTNHLAHFLLFQLLKPALLNASTPDFNSRVVSVSSISHIMSPIIFDDLDLKKCGYHPHKAYAQSKTANIYLANEVMCCILQASQCIHVDQLCMTACAVAVQCAC